MSDVASRLTNRPQVSTDGLRAYVEAIENAFGADVDYGVIIKNYGIDKGEHHQERRYSAPAVTFCEKQVMTGQPDMDLVCTSHVERLNGITRLHMRRLTRLTHSFSKKLEHFEAAVALNFAYYNLVRTHGSLKMTPAMYAGIEKSFLDSRRLNRGRRMNHSQYIEEIKAAILNLHHSRSEYLETVPVSEVFQGQTIWEGEVEVFELKDHPKARKAYAWGYPEGDSDDARTYVTVLELPPVESPVTAVRASIVKDYRDEQKQKH